jgi:hypothetical protein
MSREEAVMTQEHKVIFRTKRRRTVDAPDTSKRPTIISA